MNIKLRTRTTRGG